MQRSLRVERPATAPVPAEAAASSSVAPALVPAVSGPALIPTLAPVPVRAVPDTPVRDLAAAQSAAADLLRALGLRLDTESLRDTPRRMVQALAELLTPREF